MLDLGEALIFGSHMLQALPTCMSIRSKTCSIHKILPIALAGVLQLPIPSFLSYPIVALITFTIKLKAEFGLGPFTTELSGDQALCFLLLRCLKQSYLLLQGLLAEPDKMYCYIMSIDGFFLIYNKSLSLKSKISIMLNKKS